MNASFVDKNTAKKKDTGYADKIELSFYLDPPMEELSIDEFELLSLDRLQLLRAIEVFKTRGFDDQMLRNKVQELEKKHLKAKKDCYARLSFTERDQIGHFILRLAYCKTEEFRRWFLDKEATLFKCRLETMTDDQRQMFMLKNDIEFQILTDAEKSQKKHLLIGLAGIKSEANLLSTAFYKVPFTKALQLVGSRSVYLEKGFAYVPLEKLVSVFVNQFRSHLSRSLSEAFLMFDMVTADTRIGPLLKNMSKQFIGNDFSTQKAGALDKLTPEKIDQAAENNMPMCMKNLHMGLKREHKLKHWGRLQYTLFLKGAGLDHDGAQAFWESHFAKIMSHDQYIKQYSYMFRHMYGKEGSRKNYTPYSCMKIIMGAPPEPGAYHGCPYRHMPDNQLASLLMGQKLNSNDIREVIKMAKDGNYQLACQKHFDITHPGHYDMDLKITDSVANHPNQWFQASMNYYKIKNGNKPVPLVGADSQASTVASFQAQPGSSNVEGTSAANVVSQDVKMEEA